MAKVIGLPKLSPTMDEGTLAKWHKKEGDPIAVDDLLAEVETDKATMEFRSFDKGVLLKILAPEGSVLAPDAPAMIVGQAGEDISGLLASGGKGQSGPVVKAEGTIPPEKKDLSKVAAAPIAAQALPAEPRREGRVLASPLVRRMAREHELDLSQVVGSGPHGRIIKRDVDDVIAKGSASSGHVATVSVSAERRPARIEKLSSMRKTIARRLTESKQQVPHFYLTIDIDASPLVEARMMMNKTLEKSGEKVSLNDLLIKACAIALRKVPSVNASFLGDAIAYHQNVDISVAVAIPDGLVTPVVRDADKKGVLAISREVRELAGRAKEKKLKPEEMSDGTFSISNLGMYDIESFSAVINPPEGAILAVGAVRQEPVIKDGELVAGSRMRMTMSCDHRVVDGAIGAEWLKVLKSLLEAPMTMLL